MRDGLGRRLMRGGVFEALAERAEGVIERYGVAGVVLIFSFSICALAEAAIGARLSVIYGDRLAPRGRWLRMLISLILYVLLLGSGAMLIGGMVLWFMHLFQVFSSMELSQFGRGNGRWAIALLFGSMLVAFVRSLFFVFVQPNNEDRKAISVELALSRARELASKARQAERSGELERALAYKADALAVYGSDTLSDRWWLARQEALLHWGCADILKTLGRADEAHSSYEQAQTLYDSDRIGPWLRLNLERFQLFVAMTDVVSSMSDSGAWFRGRSIRMAETLEMAPPEMGTDNPWEQLRSDFAELHARWLRAALASGDLDRVPEVLAAVQGRDIAAEIMDKAEDSSVPGPVAEYQRIRRELRRLAERGKQRPRGAAKEGRAPPPSSQSDDDRRDANDKAFLDEPETDAQLVDDLSAYRELHAELASLRTIASQEPGFELLAAPHRQLTAAGLMSILDHDEALLLVFPDPETHLSELDASDFPDQHQRNSGNAVIFRGDGCSAHVSGAEILESATRMSEFAGTCSSRLGMRKGGYETPGLAAEQENFEMDMGFWENLERFQENALWSRLAPHLHGVQRIVGATYGSLHQLSLSVGAPADRLIVQYPGLVFFALRRGLFSRPIGQTTERRILELRFEGKDTRRTFEKAMGPRVPTSRDSQPRRIGIIVDSGKGTIPMAEAEGTAVAEIWRQVAWSKLETPCLWPAGEPLSLLHIASHGALIKGRGPHPIPAIAIDEDLLIDERVIARGAPVDVVFLNICLGGRNVDDPLDGSPSGLVSGFLRASTRVVIAALPPIPDLWAFVLGLLVTHELAGGESRAEIALARAKERLADGDWPDTLEPAFRQAFEDAMVPQIAAHVSAKSFGLEDLPEDVLIAVSDCSAWWFDPDALVGLGPLLDATPEHLRLERVTDTLTAAARARLDEAIEARVPSPGDLGLLCHGVIAFGETCSSLGETIEA